MRLASGNHLNRILQCTTAICHSWKSRVSGYDFGNWLNNNNNNKNSWHLARQVSFIPKGAQVLRIGKCSQLWEGQWHLAQPWERRKGSSPRTVQASSWKRSHKLLFSTCRNTTLDFHLFRTSDKKKNKLLCPALGRNYWEKIDLVVDELRFRKYPNGSPWHTFYYTGSHCSWRLATRG